MLNRKECLGYHRSGYVRTVSCWDLRSCSDFVQGRIKKKKQKRNLNKSEQVQPSAEKVGVKINHDTRIKSLTKFAFVFLCLAVKLTTICMAMAMCRAPALITTTMLLCRRSSSEVVRLGITNKNCNKKRSQIPICENK